MAYRLCKPFPCPESLALRLLVYPLCTGRGV